MDKINIKYFFNNLFTTSSLSFLPISFNYLDPILRNENPSVGQTQTKYFEMGTHGLKLNRPCDNVSSSNILEYSGIELLSRLNQPFYF